MDYRLKIIIGLTCAALLAFLSVQTPVFAKGSSVAVDRHERQSYIVVLEDLPLAAYDGRTIHTPERNSAALRMPATANRFTGARKLDVRSPNSRKYLEFLDERFDSFRGEALLRLGRQLKARYRYRNALNGFAVSLSEAEVRAMRELPGVKAIYPDEVQHLQTDSGPAWIGADIIHNGDAGFTATGGEGIVIGIIDSGINWDHYSFSDPGEGIAPGNGVWDHVNPYPSQLGLCSEPEVLCNDKLVGVYDFVEDNPETEEIEEDNNGKDNAGHGSHVASIAAGNPDQVFLNDIATTLGGVAPNANIISYRVCYIADPVDPADDGCDTSAILNAIEQAIDDEVDVVNYSIGTDLLSPWEFQNLAFLNLRAAGIFVATSAGNNGSNAGSIGSPANVPWITAVANATHDRVFASSLENFSGGDTPPPPDLIGASYTVGIESRPIVHAADYGYPLCYTGQDESGATCAENTGASNPFPPGTFDGEIVVCERGGAGRVEKGKNVALGGAGGFVLINTPNWGEAIVHDDHCLPATHLGFNDGETLTAWMDSGSGHNAAISGFSIFHIPEAGDSISSSSSRGPNLAPAADVLKPDVIAPGTLILGASSEEDNYAFLSGTSMASPHVSGGAALLKSIHPDWSPDIINSAIMMTATPELALDYDGSIATPHKRGAGRPRLDQAANAGLYLEESVGDFQMADPAQGGDPKNLNLPGLVDSACQHFCSFERTVTDLARGASWSASVEGVASGVSVTVSPSSFTLSRDASRQLTINVDLTKATGVTGTWVTGAVRLKSAGLPDAVFPLAVFADGGELPAEWVINSNSSSGWQTVSLENLVSMPDATYTSGGLVEPTITIEQLPQDPSEDDVYDRSAGLMTVWHTVPADTLWLHAEVLASAAQDADLYVGLDLNRDGIAQESEELCASYSPTELDFCDLYTPDSGNYWIIVQNWAATGSLDEIVLQSAVVGKTSPSSFVASGNGIVPTLEAHDIRLSWDNVNAVPGTELIGAVGIGTHREQPNNIGIIPVRFTKTGIEEPETLVLMNGVSRGLTLGANTQHDRSFIDVPPGSGSLTIKASGADGLQSENLEIELYRMEFDDAFANAPFAVVPDTSGSPVASASGSAGVGPEVSVSGETLIPGRWFVVLRNEHSEPAAVEVQADVTFSGEQIPLRGGLWGSVSRPGINQGYDYNQSGVSRAVIWYTYDEDGNPAWYVASNLEPAGNIWVADLHRATNDGTLQQSKVVGSVSITTLAEEDEIFSFVLFGDEGSDRAIPTSPPICPTVDGMERSYTGLWSQPAGRGGASALVNATSQGYIHYIYDDSGKPVWLVGSGGVDDLPDSKDMGLIQLSGFCAVCTGDTPTYVDVGTFAANYADEDNLTWNLNYTLKPPLSGSVNRTDITAKLTWRLACQ